MVKIIHKIQCEISKPNFFQAIVAKQFDSGSRFLNVTFANENNKIDLPKNATVTINATRTDGTEESFPGEVDNDGTATVPLTYWMLELEGKVVCDVSAIDSEGRKLTTTNFTIEVERASCNNSVAPGDESYDLVVRLVGITNDLQEQVDALNSGGLALKDDVIKEQVNEWLDTHPEATVRKGSVTIDKLADETKDFIRCGVINVKDFGAKGDGTTDDTENINAMFDSLNGGETVYFPSGTYLVSNKVVWHSGNNSSQRWAAISINNKNNLKIILSSGAKIKLSPVSDTTQVGIFHLMKCNDIEITGGTIEGDKESHTNDETLNSGINGIQALYCQNVYIHNMNINNCFGDGVFVAPFPYGDYQDLNLSPKNIVTENCTIHDCARNGITYEGVIDGVIRNCLIFNVGGKNPQSGIDLETEHEGYRNENILITGCKMYDCIQAVAVSTNTYNTLIADCDFGLLSINQSNTSIGDLKVKNCKFGKMFVSFKCDIENCEIEGVATQSATEGSAKAYLKDCIVKGNSSSVMEITTNGDSLMCDSCVFLKENPITSGSLRFIAKKGLTTIPYELVFNNCTFNIWDNLTMFELGDDNAKKIEFNHCDFYYTTKNTIRALVATITNVLKVVGCIFHCEEMENGMSSDYGSATGLIYVKQNGNSVYSIIDNKIIGNDKLKSFVTFRNGTDSGVTYLFNNLSNIDNINSNTPTLGTLNSYGNVSKNTVSEIQEISALVGGA